MRISVEVSPGELLDKLTILEIKEQRITDPAKLENIRREKETLEMSASRHIDASAAIDEDKRALKAVNERLWEIEDEIREHERSQTFDARFIELARSVYVENDQRAALKKRINEHLGSDIAEEKSYAAY